MKTPKLKVWRETMGQTQANLSERSGVSEHTISGIERGAELRPSTAKKLADALGVAVADLVENPPAPVGKVEAPNTGQPSPRSPEDFEKLLDEWARTLYENAEVRRRLAEGHEEFARKLSEGLIERAKEGRREEERRDVG